MSASFDVVAAHAARLVFVHEPAISIVAGEVTSVHVRVQDTFGNFVSDVRATVLLQLRSSDATSHRTHDEVHVGECVLGRVHFNPSVQMAGSALQWVAHADSLSMAESSLFNVQPAQPSSIRFEREPPHSVVAGMRMQPPPVVAVYDAFSNRLIDLDAHFEVRLVPIWGPIDRSVRGCAVCS